MAIWSRFRRGAEQRSINSLPWIAGQGWGAGWPSPGQGREVGLERALTLVPVYGAIRFLADNIASLAGGLGLYKLDPRNPDIAVRQPTPALFANPSIHGTLFDWLHKAVIGMAGHGNTVGLVTQRDSTGFPTMIEWLNPMNVQVLDRAIEGPGSYVDPRWYWWGRPMDPRDLLHIPLFCMPWRVWGMSPMRAFMHTVNIGLGAQEFAEDWYGNGGVPPGTFRNTMQKVLPDDADEIMNRVSKNIRRRQPLVYGADWEYTPIMVNPMEARFIETLQMNATQVAVIYGVPPEKLGGVVGDSLTYSTVEMNTADTLTFSFRPWLIRYEFAFSTCFPRGQFVRFSTDDFLRVDAKTRAEIDALSLGFQNLGWRDENEVRASYNLPPRAPRPAPPTTAAAAGRGAAPQPAGGRGNGQQPPNTTRPGPQPGTSSAAAEPISRTMRDRRTNNGHTNGSVMEGASNG